MIATHLAAFLAALLMSFLLTLGVRNLALRQGWVALPDSKRHLHAAAIPRLGGVAIFLSFLTVTGLLFLASRVFHFDLGFSATDFLLILVPAVTVFLLGLVDDVYSLPAWVKFSFQGLAGAMLFFGGLQVGRVSLLFGSEYLSWLVALPLTILWVLLITNAFNLIDGLDGLAAGSALFATVTIFVVASSPKTPLLLVSLLTIILAGAILGFLRFNFNPATVFLGDCGSLFLG
ncbi:MAG: MraY family glycosyltransferase, partial [Burkholderiales bacterium]